jgi:hypothetical protein
MLARASATKVGARKEPQRSTVSPVAGPLSLALGCAFYSAALQLVLGNTVVLVPLPQLG